jgi:hypothetical protein
MTQVVSAVVGSIVVYVVVAACGSDGAGGGGGDGGTGLVDSLVDSLANPVGDAKAEPNGSGSRLKAKYLSGGDGSKQFLFEFHDTERNEDCSFKLASDMKTRCLPDGRKAELYADAACTQPVIAEKPACTYVVEELQPLPPNGCTMVLPKPRFRILTKSTTPVPGSTIIYVNNGTCQSLTVASNYEGTLFTSAEVAPTSFVEATAAVEP